MDIYISYNTKAFTNTKVKVAFETAVNQLYVTSCIINDIKSTQNANSPCAKVTFTVVFPTDRWCAIYLKYPSQSNDYLNMFYIKQYSCPPGFIEIAKKCVCYPKFTQFGISSCNINDQTILRPANSWISATLHNNSYLYQINLQCPFHYCLPHPLYLNFSVSNSQCQFKRSGVLCGHCQQGLSSVFASSRCQFCSNNYLLLVIPIAIAGIVLVLMLFIVNLTVTEGTINAFIFYANVTGIRAAVLLHEDTLGYIFTSLANLDLGIQICFYNGMDDYAKMWLQLAFPFYLIFIATLLIIASRHSTKIQRLTARRALPVLATLFLLSYTKILHAVSIVLFSYSTITQLPSEQSTLVWSVDANVPILGVKFIILFITCLIIFLIQVPFTIILFFSRPLRRFHCINKFKPLLDAYQGPYKDKFYYWCGLQLVIRVLFLGIPTLDNNRMLALDNIIAAAMCVMTGIAHPFKNKFHNYHELLLLLDLQILYIAVHHNFSVITINIVIAMVVFHFIIIVVYHVISYMCGGVIRNKIQQGANATMGWIRNRSTVQLQNFKLANIPEVAYNYHEYREPLLVQQQ